jgi:heme ABC exporter ATP-binding subunit CcmA
VSLRVGQGEVVGIEGHNGSGKSTLLRVIATLLKPTGGTVSVYGRDIRTDPDFARGHLALLGVQPGLYDDLTAHENLVFAAELLGRDPAGVDAVLDRVGLRREAAERVRTFSSGMQRRLALGRLLLQQPRLLLLDEPYNSFDKAGVALVNEVVRDVVRQGGAAVVVLHDRHSAEGLLDRVMTMHAGRFVDGDTDALPLPPVPEPEFSQA